ncbi:type II secretion system secretin GspD [Ralstonia sp. UNC404CL21Col]|uniref:type II secretion system secretin GspD n=1 Tax=Ralstonia sp. UNC404CL21Col TaxID=1380362 RepID=UPI00048440CC|nr:type II secretion system secretin GspD [Ralstonia sp. UNC404CL21Col]
MNETMYNASSRLTVRAIVLACCATMVAGSMPVFAAPPSAASSQNGAAGNPGDEVSLNFVNADLDSVVKAVGQATGKNFIVDPRVKGTVNLVTEKPVTRSQALESLGSILRMQGYAIVEGNGFTKVVPEADAKLQGSPTSVGAAGARGGEQVVTQVFRLQHESANNLVPVLRPMIAPNNTITAYPANNTLVITDYADNLRRIGRIIASIDTPVAGETELIPLKNAVAIDVAATLQKLLDPSAGGAGGAAGAGAALSDPSLRTSVVAEPRSNSVMVRASSAARLAQAKQLIAKLDVPNARPGNIWVVPLKNANAVQLATTLRAIVAADATLSASASTGPGGQSAAQGATSQPAGGVSNLQNQNTQNTNYGSGSGSGSGSGGGSSSFRASFGQNNTPTTGGIIQADPATNALIITASEPVYRNLRAVIDDLDARRAQVYIESMIVEVTATKASQLGIQWLVGGGGPGTFIGGGTNYGTGSGNLISLAGTIAAIGSGGIGGTAAQTALTSLNVGQLNGGNFGVFNRGSGLGVLLSALGSDGSVNVLSTPNLITLDNEEAKILIGQNVPITTGSYAQTGTSASVSPFQTFDRKDVGITLRVKPQITDGGLVKMQIFQESSAVVPGTQNATQGPTTNVRSIETNVLANDGQVVVLGGLLEDNYQDGEQKVPGLGDIPILGALFRSENKTRVKTNLLVFLRPIILRTADATGALSDNRYNYMRDTQQGFVSPNMLPTTSDKDTPVLPTPEAMRPADNYGDVSIVPKGPAGTQVPPGAPMPMPQGTTRSQPRLQNFAAPTSGGYDGNAPRNGG